MKVALDDDVPVNASHGGFMESFDGAHDVVCGLEAVRCIADLYWLAASFSVSPRLV
jgi:hypothetical protein